MAPAHSPALAHASAGTSPMNQDKAQAPMAKSGLDRVQTARKWALFGLGAVLIPALLFVDSTWRATAHDFYEGIEYVGVWLIVLCALGRTWCSLYIGGRKIAELVTAGPYSVTRNPLYLLTLIGVAGMMMQAGSLVLAVVGTLGVGLVFWLVVQREEAALRETFGAAFTAYIERVPQFWPRFSAWRDVDVLTVLPSRIRRTLLDASLFLLAIPIADAIETAQQAGWLPVLLLLP